MEHNPVPKPKKSSRNAWIFIGVLILIPVIGAAIPFFCISDGTENFSGEQKAAAAAEVVPNVHQLTGLDRFMDTFDFVFKTRADRVYPMPDEGAKSWCGSIYEPGNAYYAVDLSKYTFFGIKVGEETVYDACILM